MNLKEAEFMKSRRAIPPIKSSSAGIMRRAHGC
jgi:hypothetical protein